MCNKPVTKQNTMGSLANDINSHPHSSNLEIGMPLQLDGMDSKRKLPADSSNHSPQAKKHRSSDPAKVSDVKQSSEAGKPVGVGVESYNDMDVLSGRGGGTNLHPGNRHYRDLILAHRRTYDIASKSKKPGVSRKIVQMVRDRGGCFLRKEKDGLYYDIGDEAAREKTSQALRHRTFEMRNKEDPQRIKDKGGRGMVHSEHSSLSSSVLAKEAELRAMEKHLDLSSSDSSKLLGHPSLGSQQLQEQFYQEALARQRQLQAVDCRHQDPAYMKALYALRQREAAFDLDKAIQDAQMRRHLSLTSGLPFSQANSLTGMLGTSRPLPSLGLASHRDPALFLMPDRMGHQSQANNGILRRDLSDGGSMMPQQGSSLRPSFLPEGATRPCL